MSGVMNPGRKDTSLLTTVMKGLSIARDIYGIKADQAKLEAAQAAQDRQIALEDEARAETKAEKARLARGEFNTGERQKAMVAGGLVEAKQGEAGAMPFGVDAHGLPMYVRKYTQGSKTPLQKITTVDAKGNKVSKFVTPKEGETYPEYTEPNDDPNKVSLGYSTDLRKEYLGHPVTKRTSALIDSYRAIESAASNPSPNGASDISMVFSFMKMIDPQSTVREGEFATAENSGGVSAAITNLYNKVLSGQRLTPEQKNNFAQEAGSLLDQQLTSQGEVDNRYSGLASEYKAPAGQVVDPRFGQMGEYRRGKQKPKSNLSGPLVFPIESDGQKTTQTTKPPPSGKPKAGAIVEIQGTRYRVAEDGDTLEAIGATGAN